MRVNAINPGSIRTDRLTARIRCLADDKGVCAEERFSSSCPDARVCDIISLVTYRHAGRDFRLPDVHGQVAQDLLV